MVCDKQKTNNEVLVLVYDKAHDLLGQRIKTIVKWAFTVT